MIKTGEVSSVNLSERTARVKFDDMGIVSAELKIIKRPRIIIVEDAVKGTTHQHTHKTKLLEWSPKVGDRVIVGFVDNNEGDGYILGGV